MTEAETHQAFDYVELSADIVSAYVSNNSLPASEIGNLLTSVHAAVSSLTKGGNASPTKEDEVEKATPAQIKKSITPDALISFEDGKSYKTLRRHLTIRGLTPESYRAKYGLPADYPMVSAGYSAQRSELAKALGLGQQRKDSGKAAGPKVAQSDETIAEAPADEKPKRAGRPRKGVAAN
ncbi:MucR family transcriptional regulator [Methylobacterium sp. J-090]|uniref:MucR family transcriptional regulator n=1 Tax=Methylobacterium sp. J-090 TaxID=2836666 RepID=UPI001FB8628B|nr:MucR family transcriptional regulator [Methylobacterium sp. J-090]MCJ2079886.1 MucR family transcriptional regulator [Methylobacterium sp. J-090]